MGARKLEREPSLTDMLEDPVLHAVMRRDGISREALERVITDARSRLYGFPTCKVQDKSGR
jgi:hypothetical protein